MPRAFFRCARPLRSRRLGGREVRLRQVPPASPADASEECVAILSFVKNSDGVVKRGGEKERQCRPSAFYFLLSPPSQKRVARVAKWTCRDTSPLTTRSTPCHVGCVVSFPSRGRRATRAPLSSSLSRSAPNKPAASATIGAAAPYYVCRHAGAIGVAGYNNCRERESRTTRGVARAASL